MLFNEHCRLCCFKTRVWNIQAAKSFFGLDLAKTAACGTQKFINLNLYEVNRNHVNVEGRTRNINYEVERT